jgi:hypothetical protein
MKNREELLKGALAFLSLIKAAQHKVDEMLRYNVEIATPNDFSLHSDESIDFQKAVVKRLERSYNNIIQQLYEYPNR